MLSAIVAVSENFVIGRRGDLPWHLPADLKRFKELTMGHHIIMGRKTYDSIGRPLPGRTSVVITRDAAYRPAGRESGSVIVVSSIEAAFSHVAADDEAFIIGGESIFRGGLAACERLYLTLVEARVEGDVYFPGESLDAWRLEQEERHPADDRNAHSYSFRVYSRRHGALTTRRGGTAGGW